MLRSSVVVLAALLSLTGAPNAGDAAQKWTVKGKVMVQHLLPEAAEIFGVKSGLLEVLVKVSARSRVLGVWGTWNSWGEFPTGRDGSFRVSETHGSDRRQFKVQVLFDSKRRRLKEGKESSIITWDSKGFPLGIEFDLTDKDRFVIHNDKDGAARDGRKAGVIDLGNIVIKKGVVRKLADVWVLYNEIFDLLEDYGPTYAFQNKVSLKYPLKLGRISYANPVNGNLLIDEHQFNSSTIFHELIHLWI